MCHFMHKKLFISYRIKDNISSTQPVSYKMFQEGGLEVMGTYKQRCGYLPSLRAPLPQEGPQMKELVTLLGVGPWELEISDSGR